MDLVKRGESWVVSQFDPEIAILAVSFPRRRESKGTKLWMPAYASMTYY